MDGWMDEAADIRETRDRILDAARAEIVQAGWAVATSGRVAHRTGVSKALIHYHFQDKDSLLCAIAEQCRANVVARSERGAGLAAHANPVDAFSEWLEGELEARDLCIALQLKISGRDSIVRAAEAVLLAFRSALRRQERLVFRALGLTPVVPTDSIVDLFMAMAEGEALVPMEPPTRRRMVETVWLSLLTVSE